MNRNEWLIEEGKRLDREIAWGIVQIERLIALARHKRNSSYYMRKEGNPLIAKREGIPAITWPRNALRAWRRPFKQDYPAYPPYQPFIKAGE